MATESGDSSNLTSIHVSSKETPESKVEILEETYVLTINAVDFKVQHVALACGGDTRVAKTILQDEEKQELEIRFEGKISKSSSAILSLDFEAILNDNGVGFYRTPFTDESGNKRYLACTQMQPVDCRRAFPYFDEPALKAAFSITLIAPKAMTCLSNMNVLSEKAHGDNKKLVKFARTPLMSTYLVAMVIGDLEYIEKTSFRIPVRIYTTPGLSARAQFALDLTVKTLQFYEKAFDSPFPLPKMDTISIPDMFVAMENWGLIIGTSTCYLLDEKTSSVNDLKRYQQDMDILAARHAAD